MSWGSALKRTAYLTGVTALFETGRRVIKRQKRARAMQRSKSFLKRVGVAAAFAGLAFLVRGVTLR